MKTFIVKLHLDYMFLKKPQTLRTSECLDGNAGSMGWVIFLLPLLLS